MTADAHGQLVNYTGSGSASYTYGADGKRVSKTVNGTTTQFAWNGDNIVYESNGTKYYYGNGLTAIAPQGSANKNYYLYDGHGSVTQLTDSAGTTIADYRYDAFGNQLQAEQSDEYNPFRYSGEYTDEESGMIYLRARYYDTSIGRFISEDTHWSPQNMIYGDNVNQEKPLPNIEAILQSGNLYVYCMSNPLLYHDYTGNSAATLTAAAGFAAVDGPIPVGDLIAAGIVVYEGGKWVWNNREKIANGFMWTVRAVGGWFISESSRTNWDVSGNTKHHILNGTNGSHQSGWQKFGIDPNDPNSFAKLLPILKLVVDEGKKVIERGVDNGGRILEYTKYIEEKGMTIWVRVYEYADGVRILTDAAEYTK